MMELQTEIITCSNCKEKLYKWKNQYKDDDIIRANHFTPHLKNILQPQGNDKIECPKCKYPLVYEIRRVYRKTKNDIAG